MEKEKVATAKKPTQLTKQIFQKQFFYFFRASAQRFALPALGRGRRSRPTRKMIRRVKLLEIAAESPASGARFVGRILQDA